MLWQIHQFCKYETKSKLISSNSRLASEIHAGMFTYEHRETFHLLPSWVIEVKWWFLKGYGLDFFFLMWFWNDWWSVSLFGEQSQMRFSFICLKCPSYKYSLLYFALNNSKPLLLSEAPSGNFVFLFNSKILKKRDIQGWVWAKNKKQDSGNGRESCRILWGFFKSTTNCAAQLKLPKGGAKLSWRTLRGWDKAARSQWETACRSLWEGSLRAFKVTSQ